MICAITLATAGVCFTACDPQPAPHEDAEPLSGRSLAGNGTTFELDGNAANGTNTDWQSLVPDGVPDVSNTDFPDVVFSNDVKANADDVFSGGGSKDPQPLSRWRHKQGKASPDKDNLTNAYAATHFTADGDLLIYFGADRFANEGDAQLGFWFFQDEVTLNDNGTFEGEHQDDDLLVLANFSNGGAVAQIEVFKWESGGLVQVLDGSALCTNPGDTDACAISNGSSATTQSFWRYDGKGQTPDDSAPYNPFLPFTFFEGGVNITNVFGGDEGTTPCFASFMAETRASTSESATLKDFVLDSFQVCQPKLAVRAKCRETTLDATNPAGVRVQVNYTVLEVCNEGTGVDVSDIVVEVNGEPLMSGLTLSPGECTDPQDGFYFPTTTSSADPGAAEFPVDVTAEGEADLGGSTGTVRVEADPVDLACPLCP